MSTGSTRDEIVAAADELFYRQGFEHTSFSDIADAVRISRGNFYHHFKSKDEILGAVIQARLAHTQRMLDEWEAGDERPDARIRSFIHILIRNQADIQLYGCPVGTLNAELAKLDHASRGEAAALFTMFRDWLARQFALMGCGRASDALAMHLLGRSQGVAALANAFADATFVRREVRQMCEWLDMQVELASRTTRGRAAPSRR